jgi:hypothetical protein
MPVDAKPQGQRGFGRQLASRWQHPPRNLAGKALFDLAPDGLPRAAFNRHFVLL